ncbi:hypothetical protein FG386_002214 [Cryptosporidium ryanae]|uniref:uncharacterized protein n=1 Tax=Cryptosporidium ryanae TaxID=515981 RepID=UPI00351A4B57|nr:hypothetical protein FG386_002214 [Cryptosporidium ryanae]
MGLRLSLFLLLVTYLVELGPCMENALLSYLIKANNLRRDKFILREFLENSRSNYFGFGEGKLSCSDDFVEVNGFTFLQSNFQRYSVPVHKPSEVKNYDFFKANAPQLFLMNIGPEGAFFPRIKHFKRNLPKLTPEPYQRVMSFAIEVCMIPSLWFIELIHCMYVGMAPYFKGMLMSYSLQDLVGSAIKSITYLDQTFSRINCVISVSSVSDGDISRNADNICKRMYVCLKNNEFFSDELTRLRKQLEVRINSAYLKLVDVKKLAETKRLAKYFILLFLSSKRISINVLDHFPERNFLVIRAMVIALSLSLENSIANMNLTTVDTVKLVIKFLSSAFYSSIDNYFTYCKRKFLSFSRENVYTSLLSTHICIEMVSFGFIDESVEIFGDQEIFKSAVMPNRINVKDYLAFAPSSMPTLPLDESNVRWLHFQGDAVTVPYPADSRASVVGARGLRYVKGVAGRTFLSTVCKDIEKTRTGRRASTSLNMFKSKKKKIFNKIRKLN